jgi:hypothetical protein
MRVLQLTRGLVLAAIVLLPVVAQAQSLAGTVRDSSGGALPGVTVEAASNVLIEKVRTTVTDNTGQYQILALPPGTYRVTFSLAGFNGAVREGVQVSGGGVITINADMRVGGIQETVTVTGETPVVDIRTARRETVLDDEVVAALPSSRGVGNILSAVPGVITNQFNSGTDPRMTFFSARGGNGNEGTVQIDGMNVGAVFNGGGTSEFGYDTAAAQEVQVTIGGATGEADRGGPSLNLIPKSGGNTFSGTAFGSFAGSWSQGSNIDDELIAAGLREPPELYKMWDTSFALGGPVLRDRLWFYGTLRSRGVQTAVPGLFANLNQGDPNAWNYVPNEAIRVRDANSKKIGQIRLTGQATPSNKLSFFIDYQLACEDGSLVSGGGCLEPGDDWVALGSVGGFGSSSPEAATNWDDREKILQASWSAPATNRLLLEAGYSALNSRWGGQIPHGALTDFIPVFELISNSATQTPAGAFTYRGVGTSPTLDQQHNSYRASASYVTGSHNIKLGYQGAYLIHHQWNNGYGPHMSYTSLGLAGFNPTSVTIRSTQAQSNRTMFNAFYAQDSWTVNRLTLSGALRFDRASSWAPGGENRIHASPWNPTDVVFDRVDGVTGYNDISPRIGAAYDVFGTGKTSIRVNWGKYLRAANNEDVYTVNNPAVTYRFSTSINWTDVDGDRVVDCNLRQQNTPTLAGQTDVCNGWNNPDFNSPFSVTTVDPAVLSGWGVRQFDRQFNVSVQQELFPRMSIELGYARRSWDNIFFTTNRDLTAAHYDIIDFPIPQHPDLPGGGGGTAQYQIITQAGQSQFGDNFFTQAPADDVYYWQGFDVNFNARFQNGLTVQGGTTTGRGRQDYCDVWAEFPSLVGNNRLDACDVKEDWNTNLRMLAAYTIPKVDVLVSFIGRSTLNASAGVGFGGFASNGGSLSANYAVPASVITPILNRPLANNAASQTLNLTKQGDVYGPRVNSFDFRFAKIVRVGPSRATIGIDLYNAFNSNTPTGFSTAFNPANQAWLRPTTVLNPRFLRFNVSYDF